MSAAAGDESVRIDTVKVEELERLLPLVEDCQLAAGVPDVERGRNRGYFGRLIAPSQFGALIAAWRGRQAIGFTCLHWTLDSVGVRETVTLHVLYVAPEERGAGIGRALIEAAAELARARGAQALVWQAEHGNHAAQRLYDSLPTRSTRWIDYELAV
ncbi:MAG TPA: GNAT family N-acetyltransferase [Solirubrobacterales bacterium]|nr:GNAT family N-acetyltransferase [Solirubrobacterales bacterium]